MNLRASALALIIAGRPQSARKRSALARRWTTHATRHDQAASFARLVIAKLEARRAAGETLDRIASLQDHVKAFA